MLSSGLGLIYDPIRKKVTDDPGNTTPISITNVSASPSGGSCVITWTTDQLSSSLVRYGRAPNKDQVTPETDTTGTLSHSVTLTNLTVGKPYLYQVQSRYVTGKDGMNRSVLDGYVFLQDAVFVAV